MLYSVHVWCICEGSSRRMFVVPWLLCITCLWVLRYWTPDLRASFSLWPLAKSWYSLKLFSFLNFALKEFLLNSLDYFILYAIRFRDISYTVHLGKFNLVYFQSRTPPISYTGNFVHCNLVPNTLCILQSRAQYITYTLIPWKIFVLY